MQQAIACTLGLKENNALDSQALVRILGVKASYTLDRLVGGGHAEEELPAQRRNPPASRYQPRAVQPQHKLNRLS